MFNLIGNLSRLVDRGFGTADEVANTVRMTKTEYTAKFAQSRCRAPMRHPGRNISLDGRRSSSLKGSNRRSKVFGND